MYSGDNILQKYIKNNLNYWKNKNLSEKKLKEVIKKYNLKVVQIEIKNKNAKILQLFNTKKNAYLQKSLDFLKDVAYSFPNLNTKIYLNITDTLVYDKINIYNIKTGQKSTIRNKDFVWGVCQSNNNYIRIVESESIAELNDTFPCFCFERNKEIKGILFPAFGADNHNFKQSINIDTISWNDKNINIPIHRGNNICCDLSNIDKIKLINFSNKNKDKTDFKFSSSKNHPLWKNYIVSREHLIFFQKKNIIDKNVNIDTLRKEYFSKENFVSYEHLFKHKFIVTVSSAKNRKWYLSNSCILEYQFKNKEYFYEDIFEDMKDFVYFDEETLFDKLDKLKENNFELAQKITKNRIDTFYKYLHYPNLVKWYGLFLLEYQNLCS